MKSKTPYLFEAMYNWISDSGMTPHVVVDAAYEGVIVPREYVVQDKIVLNIDEESIDDLNFDEESLSFNAYFGDNSYKVMIFVPMGALLSIFASENSEGLAFEPENDSFTRKLSSAAKKKILQKMAIKKSKKSTSSSDKKSKPSLKIVKD